MKQKIRLLIADDHGVVRTGLALFLGCEQDLAVVGTACDGAEAVERARETSPDVVVMDLMMPGMDGVQATAQLAEVCPTARVLILTSYGTGAELRRAIGAGADGLLLKTAPAEQIAEAIRQVAAGRRVIPKDIARELEAEPNAGLSPRQLTILRSITQGFSNKEIARQVGLSVSGVKKDVAQILQLLGVSNRSEASATAMRENLLPQQ